MTLTISEQFPFDRPLFVETLFRSTSAPLRPISFHSYFASLLDCTVTLFPLSKYIQTVSQRPFSVVFPTTVVSPKLSFIHFQFLIIRSIIIIILPVSDSVTPYTSPSWNSHFWKFFIFLYNFPYILLSSKNFPYIFLTILFFYRATLLSLFATSTILHTPHHSPVLSHNRSAILESNNTRFPLRQ